jgi:hypothetical protein
MSEASRGLLDIKNSEKKMERFKSTDDEISSYKAKVQTDRLIKFLFRKVIGKYWQTMLDARTESRECPSNTPSMIQIEKKLAIQCSTIRALCIETAANKKTLLPSSLILKQRWIKYGTRAH